MGAHTSRGRTEPGPQTGPQQRDETPSQHADRNYEELVQELRVAQTSVQILFGFLLALAFYETFPVNVSLHARVLTAALLCTALASLCFTAPVVAHRLHFRQGAKERLVWVAHWMVVVGMLLFAAGMGLALWLVLARLWPDSLALAVAGATIPLVLLMWVLWPRWLIRGADPSAARPH